MTSYSSQIEAARKAHLAASSLEDSVRKQIVEAFEAWERGQLTDVTVRHALEAIVRKGYRSSSALAAASAQSASELTDWNPKLLTNSEYLKALLEDVRANLRAYKKSPKAELDRRRALLRIQHSAGVAAQRGYTDGTIDAFNQLVTKFDFEVSKIWMANFVGNVPCAVCRSLHGTVIGLHDAFSAPDKSGKVYLNLQGPPRHPNCQCYIVIVIKGLDNLDEELNVDAPPATDDTISTEEIKKVPAAFFLAIINGLRKIRDFFKGKNR